jgi:cytoplasmic iron level regulating protein YaaA (DUF328/UPF0246 family)
MLIALSPAKKLNLDYRSDSPTSRYSLPRQLDHSERLNQRLRELSEQDLQQLMHISPKLAAENHRRYHAWQTPFTTSNAKQALLMFQGDVYVELQAATFSDAEFAFAQDHLRILSGLYGLLRPLDLIQPYRLEMGTRLDNERGRNLYEFWGDRITDLLNDDLAAQGDDILINLASNEYFKSVRPKQLDGRIITPSFKENRDGKWRIIGTVAKKLRGLMASHIIREQLSDAEDLKAFVQRGYRYNEALSNDDEWVFTRGPTG